MLSATSVSLLLGLLQEAPDLITYVTNTYNSFANGEMTEDQLQAMWTKDTQAYNDGVAAWKASATA